MRQRDKLSTSWLLSLPGVDSTLSNAEFSEAAAASLCLPSPSCQAMLGETILARGRRPVDEFGDNVQAASLKGDHWRQRHDQLKFTIHRLCQWAGMPVEMEVFNLFSGLIPQQGLARIDKDRQRQSMVPDFKITLPWEGRTRPVLHELKVISCSKSRYKPSWKDRAVDRRAEHLHQEYLDKASNTDRKFCDVEEGRVGPVETKLLSFPRVQGMVFGSFGEASEAVHGLVEHIATSRVRVAGPQKGKRGVTRSEDGEKAMAVSFVRRSLSLAAVKAQSHSLLGRLVGMGRGVTAAVGRRREASEVERRWAKQRKAHSLSVRQGWNIVRRGFAWRD